MLIPLDYRVEDVLQQHAVIREKRRPGYKWPDRWPYTAEYSWACEKLATYVQQPHDKARVMDAGGGQSSMQHFLAENYGEAVNVDVKPGHHHQDCITRATLIQSDLEDTPMLDPGSFDGILSLSAIEHNDWDKILRIVRNLLSLLKPGAPLVVTVPAFEVATYYQQGEWPEPHQSWPEQFNFDADAFRDLFAAVEDLATVAEPTDLPDTEAYREQAREFYDDIQTNSLPSARRPYLSAGFVLIRK